MRGMHGAGRPHEAVTRAETELRARGAERDLALDDPEALVVIVAVRGVVGVGRIAPRERLEPVRLEPRAQRRLGRRRTFGPGNALELHVAGLGPTITTYV